MMESRKGWMLLTGLAALTPGFAAPVYAAETAAASSGDELTEIIVTARRTEENLQDVPISIAVFNQQQLENRNVVTAQDLAAYVPSLSVNTNYGADNSNFALRGFVQDTGTAPSVGVFFADVIAPRAASNGLPGGDGAGPGDFFDLENVQILKGPQGTLFGRNTTGGDVLLVPKKPTSELSGYVEGGVGNYHDGEVQGVVNIPINDNIRLRAGIVHESREGYLHSNSGIGPKDFNDLNYTSARVSLVVDILPNLENYTIGNYTTSHNNGTIGKVVTSDPTSLLFGPGPTAQLRNQGPGFYDVQQSLANPASRLQQWQVINTTTWKPSDNLTVKNIASYAQLHDYYNDEIFGTDFHFPTDGTFPYNGAPFTTTPGGVPYLFAESVPLPGSQTASERTITEEMQLQGQAFDNRLTWQGGAYFELELPNEYVGAQSGLLADCIDSGTFNCSEVFGLGISNIARALGAPIPPGFAASYLGSDNLTIGRTKYRDYAFYTQGSYKLTDQLKATAGIRWTHDEEQADDIQKTFRFLTYPNFGQLPATAGVSPLCTDGADLPLCKVSYRETSRAPTWLIDFDYTPFQDLLLYGKYTRGYREGVINPTVAPPFNVVQPEKVDAYEIGEKFSFHGPITGTVDAALFYNDFTNQQIQLGFQTNTASSHPGNPSAAPLNAGQSRIWGGEFDSSLRLFPGFRLDLDYTYLNTRIKETQQFSLPPDSPYIISGAFHAGDELTLSPRNKATATGTYTLPLPEAVGALSVGATFTYTARQLANYDDREAPDNAAQFRAFSFLQPTHLLNLNLNWNSIMQSPVDLSLFATNVTGQKYYTFVAGLGTNLGFETASIGPPTMVGLRVKIRYH
jgi:iron complex outermembrane receptor protein